MPTGPNEEPQPPSGQELFLGKVVLREFFYARLSEMQKRKAGYYGYR
jgi:hypothetical protein